MSYETWASTPVTADTQCKALADSLGPGVGRLYIANGRLYVEGVTQAQLDAGIRIFDNGAAKTHNMWRAVRARRDVLLAESDWSQLPDTPTVQEQSWKDYRQALRDITEDFDDPSKIEWPERP